MLYVQVYVRLFKKIIIPEDVSIINQNLYRVYTKSVDTP